MAQEYKVVRSEKLSQPWDNRYVVVDLVGNLLDDAQGYGYRSPQKAHAAFSYKTMSKRRRREKFKKEREIKKWLDEHPDFSDAMEDVAVHVMKGSYGQGVKFNAKFVEKMLRDDGLEPDFTAAELLRIWQKL